MAKWCLNCRKYYSEDQNECECGSLLISQEEYERLCEIQANTLNETPYNEYTTGRHSSNNSNRRFIWIGMVVIIVSAIVISTIVSRFNIEKTFKRAVSAANNHEYREAVRLFETIRDDRAQQIAEFSDEFVTLLCTDEAYEDAERWVSTAWLNDLITNEQQYRFVSEISYCEAASLVAEEAYTEAYYQYVWLDEYKDSHEKADNIFANHKDAFYELAINHFESDSVWDVKHARSIFEALGDYEESTDYLTKIDEKLMNDPEYRFQMLTMDEKVEIWNRLNQYNGSNVDAFWLQIEKEYNLTEDHLWRIIVDSDVVDAVGKARRTEKAASSAAIPHDAVLSLGSGSIVVANTKEDLDEYLLRLQNENSVGDMLLNGQIAYIDRNTKVDIVEKGIAVTKIRILEGSYKGAECWTISEAVQKR